MLNRGPQEAQLMNGYRNLRSFGSSISRRQSPQTGRSGGKTGGRFSADGFSPLRAMEKPSKRRSGIRRAETSSTTAPAGRCSRRSRRKPVTADSGPEAKISTTPPLLRTRPETCDSRAIPATKGR